MARNQSKTSSKRKATAGSPGSPKRPAPSKKAKKRADSWNSPGNFETMVAMLAQMASSCMMRDDLVLKGMRSGYEELFGSNIEPEHNQRVRDERLLQDIYDRVVRHWRQVPYASKSGARIPELSRSLALSREMTESDFRDAAERPITPERDDDVCDSVARTLRLHGLRCDKAEATAVAEAMRREFWNPISRTYEKDWLKGDAGPSETAGEFIQRLGLKKGWLGSSKGNTSKTLRMLRKQRPLALAREQPPHLRTVVFLLRCAGVPRERIPWAATVLGLAMVGTGALATLELRDRPPEIDFLLDMPFQDPSERSEVPDDVSMLIAEGRLKVLLRSIRAQVEQRFPDFRLEPVPGVPPDDANKLWRILEVRLMAMAYGKSAYFRYLQEISTWIPQAAKNTDPS